MKNETTILDDTAERHLRKYSNPNLIHQFVLRRMFDAVTREILRIEPAKTLEFGCGEGLFLQQLKTRGVAFKEIVAIDLRQDALDYAKSLHPEYKFENVDLLTWDHPQKYFDLVVASQVLEHLPEPDRFLKRLALFSNKYLLLTVPWEPWFRIMNLLRGRDIKRLGNHPEHVNLWDLSGFEKFVSKYATIEKAYTVFPFIVVIAKT